MSTTTSAINPLNNSPPPSAVNVNSNVSSSVALAAPVNRSAVVRARWKKSIKMAILMQRFLKALPRLALRGKFIDTMASALVATAVVMPMHTILMSHLQHSPAVANSRVPIKSFSAFRKARGLKKLYAGWTGFALLCGGTQFLCFAARNQLYPFMRQFAIGSKTVQTKAREKDEKGHSLVEIIPYGGRGYNCNSCQRSFGNPTSLSWHCEECMYDLCAECHQPAPENPRLSQKAEFLMELAIWVPINAVGNSLIAWFLSWQSLYPDEPSSLRVLASLFSNVRVSDLLFGPVAGVCALTAVLRCVNSNFNTRAPLLTDVAIEMLEWGFGGVALRKGLYPYRHLHPALIPASNPTWKSAGSTMLSDYSTLSAHLMPFTFVQLGVTFGAVLGVAISRKILQSLALNRTKRRLQNTYTNFLK